MVFTHGIGGAQDLPLPLSLALAGAGAALAVSFVVLALAWREPRYDGVAGGLRFPVLDMFDSVGVATVVRALGLAFAAYVAWAALTGPDSLVNPTFGVVYVLLWIGIVPASLLFGPFYRAVNPLRTLHLLISRLSGGDASTGVVALPRWVGIWPAALGLFAFVWMELVSPDNNYLGTIRLWFSIYATIVLVGAAVFGDRWIAAADPFEAYSTLVGHLSVFGRDDEGHLVVQSPLRNLARVPATPGLTGATAVLVGSTAFDSFKDSVAWLRFSVERDMNVEVLNTAALLAFCVAVGTLLTVATVLVRPDGGVSTRSMPDRLAHSLVPIVVGYMVAHYLSLFVEKGQETVILLSDPQATGANYLGTADLAVSYWLSGRQTLLAWLKVLAIVAGHVLGVVAAHDRALSLLARRDRLVGQLPLLFVMVFFTVGGLYLLLTV